MSTVERWLRNYRCVGTWVVGTIFTIAVSRAAYSQESTTATALKPTPTKFLRLTKTESGQPKSLDVAVTKFRSPQSAGPTVDLIGAVHIGERQYYNQLNTLFDGYDVLLYELVAPENTVIPRGGKRGSSNPVAMLQDTAKNMLGLESQLELIDYTKAHFVRADMTPQQIAEKMAERGETAFTIALSTLADAMRQQNQKTQPGGNQSEQVAAPEIGLFDMLGNPLKMKQVFARQFAATGSLDQSLGGALNQMLVIDRNGEAIKSLQKQLAAGKQKIGIFYGAAHMPDFEKRLVADFGLQVVEQSWVVAWDLQRGPVDSTAEPASLLLNVIKALSE